jgi:hypothetical protein
LVCCAGEAAAELEPKSRNAVLFVESVQEGHEWEAYRLAEDRRPVILEVDGPGRVLLSLRTFASEEAEPAVTVVLLDERIILTARVEPKVDEGANFPDPPKRPSKVHFYLVRVPVGVHRVTIRYSGGPPTLVAARFSENADTWEERGEGDLPLVLPSVRDRDSVPTIGRLHATDALEAEPNEERTARKVEIDREWKPAAAEPEKEREPRIGPSHASRPRSPGDWNAGDRSAIGSKRTLMVQAPWLLIEVRGGAQWNHLGLSIAPALGADARTPIPGLDARSFSAGLSLDVAHTQGESDVKHSNGGAIVGVAEVRHTAFTISADLRWVLLRERLLDPYLALGGGALVGSMSSSIDEQRITAGTRGAFGLAIAGAAWGGSGHRPYLEARVQAGLLSSDLIRANRGPYVAASLMIGFRFEFLEPVEAASNPVVPGG